MATVYTDTFTGTSGTDLFSYNANWTKHTSYGPDLNITDANRCRTTTGSGAGSRAYYYNIDPGADSYDVSATLLYQTYDTVTGQSFGVAARVSSSANTMYFVRHNPVAGQWQMFKIVAGAATALGTPYSQTYSAGNSATMKLSVYSSGSTRVELFVDGVSRVNSGDTAITARGFAGLREGSGQAGGNAIQQHLDNFTIENALGSGQPIAKRYDTLHQSRGLNWGIGIG